MSTPRAPIGDPRTTDEQVSSRDRISTSDRITSNERRSRRSGSTNPMVAGLVGLAIFALAWELVVRITDVSPGILRSPSQIATAFLEDPGVYLQATWTTLWHAVVGSAAALLLATLVGSLLAASRFAEQATQPVLVLVLVTPWVAYVTSLVRWLGPGAPPVLFLVAFVTFPGFVFAMVVGLRSANANTVELFASVAATSTQTLWRLRLPSALPTVFAATRLNTGLALAAAYFVEGANLTSGGSLGAIGRTAAAFPGGGDALWVTIVLTALLGALLLGTLSFLERSLLSWHASQR